MEYVDRQTVPAASATKGVVCDGRRSVRESREGLATAFRVRNHQTTTDSSREGAKSAMPKNRSMRNQVSRL
jgi:hypothetical protein